MDRCIGLVVFLFYCFMCFEAQSQYYVPGSVNQNQKSESLNVRKGFDRERWIPGGNFGFGGNRNVIFSELSPTLGYKVNDRILPGIMLTCMYFRGRFVGFNPNVQQRFPVLVQTVTLGFTMFSRAYVTERIFVHGEAGIFRGNRYKFDANGYYIGLSPMTVFFPLVGGGFRFPIGERSAFVIMLLYNLNFVPDFSIYGGSPYLFRIGFMF